MLLKPAGFMKAQASAYTETLVTVPSGAYLDAPAAAPGATSALLFGSLITDAALDATRNCIASWVASTLGGAFPYLNGPPGLYVAFRSGNGVSGAYGTTIPGGTRYDFLASCWSSGAVGTITLKASIRLSGGSWGDAFTDQTASADNATLDDITTTSQRLFQRLGGANDWYGQIARIAMWTATNNAEIADPGLTATQDNFALDGATSIVDPQIARDAYFATCGLPLYDFNGDASRYNSGAHDGSLGNFTPDGGTFS